jgi:DinB superfamily
MQSIALQLESTIDQHFAALQSIPESEIIYKPSPSKWSKKEILGHMIDSAQNNIRRFIVAQYEENPKIVYNQDKWVAIADYQHYDLQNLINLWYLLNKHIVVILKNMPVETAQRNCQTADTHSLDWIAQDYIKHLLHHVHQVLELEPVAYP